jgi:phosphopantothenoylcysteine decarboxylase/phosphopantothenate--cysteine ligase
MKKILFAVSGSIAAYRTYDVVKDLVRLGNEVIVVLSRGAEEFVNPKMYAYMGATQVYSHKDDFSLHPGVLHIDLARWCDLWVLCPASANTLARLSQGMADDLLSSIFLSLKDKPAVIFPAMNTQMLENPLTQNNLSILKNLSHVHLIEPKSGTLICAEVGSGKLAPSAELTALIHTFSPENKKAKKVLITTGATLSPLDPIRYLTNASTGTMGKILAQEFLARGYAVHVVCSHTSTKELEYFVQHPQFQLSKITTADDMLDVVKKSFPTCHLFIATAAVNDLTFESHNVKIKKADIPKHLAVKPNPDILAEMLKIKKAHQKIIGFGGENPCTEKLLIEKWKRKKVDLLIGNEISTPTLKQKSRGYGDDTNEYWWLENGKLKNTFLSDKNFLALEILNWFDQHAK